MTIVMFVLIVLLLKDYEMRRTATHKHRITRVRIASSLHQSSRTNNYSHNYCMEPGLRFARDLPLCDSDI